MSRASATRRASAASLALQHPCLWLSAVTMGSAPFSVEQAISSLAPERMKRPTTSYPASRRRTADTELSTPPLIARTTRVDIEIGLSTGTVTARIVSSLETFGTDNRYRTSRERQNESCVERTFDPETTNIKLV